MTIVFQVRRFFDANDKAISITAVQFEQIKSARRVIDCINKVELLFWSLSEAFRKSEESTLLLALRWSLYGPTDFANLPLERAEVGAKLDYLLSTFKRYVDSVEGILAKICDPEELRNLSEFRKQLHDQNFEYRLCYKLRNYALKYDVSAQGLSFSANRDNPSGIGEIVVSATISPTELLHWHSGSEGKNRRLDSRLETDIKELLQSGVKSINVSKAVRRLVSLVGSYQEIVREKTRTAQEQSKTVISYWTETMKSHHFDESDSNDCLAECFDDSSDAVQPETILLSALEDDVCARITIQTKSLANVHKNRVCSFTN